MPAARLHDGSSIDVEVHGTGPALLVQPLRVASGAPLEHLRLKADFDRALIESLGNRYSLVLFNYPGDPPKPSLTVTNVVRDLLSVADAAGADRFVWCGYSWTAIIGLCLSVRTNRVAGLVCGGWPPLDGPYREMHDYLVNPPDSFLSWRTPEDAQQIINFYRDLGAIDNEDVERLDCPRLCFVGDADDIYGLGIARTMRERRPALEALGWDVRILDGYDHLQLLQPAVFVSVLRDWLVTSVPAS